MSAELKFGLQHTENKEMLDRYAPEIIEDCIRKVLQETRPRWSTFRLTIEPSLWAESILDIRLTVLGEKR